MNIRELMHTPAITIRADSSANTAAQLMWEHDCGALPVVDEADRLIGIVTDRDICMAAYTQGLSLAAIPVTSAMSKQVLVCHVNDSVETAEELMREGRIRRVPVIDNDGHPVGLVGLGDLARFASHDPKGSVEEHLVQTIEAVYTPHHEHRPASKTHMH